MEVYFASTPTTGNGSAFHKIGKTQKTFRKGIYKTTDKEEIIEIISSEIYKRGEVKLVTDHQLVDNYLGGEDPDYLTMDVLNKVSDEGLKALGREYRTKNTILPNIIKAELNKQPLTDVAMQIITAHPTKTKPITTEAKREHVEGLVEAGRIDKVGVWYKKGEYKTRSYEEMYDHIMGER
jgi:hypothetical protein